MRGHDARMISPDAQNADDRISVAAAAGQRACDDAVLHANDRLQRAYVDPRRTEVSNTFFSAQVAGYHLAGHPMIDQFDIINVHWVARFLAPHNLRQLAERGHPPVVHTLHDMAAFTGGCHYSAGCRGYLEHCDPCPQLRDDVLGLTRWTLMQKRAHGTAPRVAAIAPSRWLAQCARESRVFADEQVFTIPNALDTDIFRPTETPFAKQLLGIDPNVKILLFGAENNRERRKGFDLLIDTWQQLMANARIRSLVREERIRVLVFGHGTEDLQAAGIPLCSLGTIANDSRLALVYSAADLLMLSSREDNLPNVLLEAMACGTPAVAFAIGGIPDVIDDRVDGRSIPPFDVAQMSAAVLELLENSETLVMMGAKARQKITDHHRLDIQSAAYEELFLELLERSPNRPARADSALAPPSDTLEVPVTLNPELFTHPIGLYLSQCNEIEHWKQQKAGSDYQIDRANDVLDTAIAEILASSSWRKTRSLRGVSAEPLGDDDPSPEHKAARLLNLVRSKSWELTGPVRLMTRAGRGLSRRMGQLGTRTAAAAQGVSPAHALPPGTFLVQPASDPPADAVRTQPPALNIVCLHLFHLDLWDEFCRELKPVIGPTVPLYVTLPQDHRHFITRLHREFSDEHCKVFVLDNRGMDIYPFLFVLDRLLTEGITPLTLTKLHTKKSVHHTPEDAVNWRQDLYQGLLRNFPALTRHFEQDKHLAMICSRKWWVHEDETNPNYLAERRVIQQACRLFGVSRTEHYLTGSMYIVAFDYLKKLFHGIDRAELLAGFPSDYQRSDTLAHGFERVICYAVEKYDLRVGLL